MLQRVLEPEVMDSAEEARDYDAMDHSEVNRRFVGDFLATWSGLGPILDVGVGTALILIELCRQSARAHVTGIDLAAHMLALGKVNVQKAGLQDRIRLEKQDAKQLPYGDGSFGAVISNSIVHHIPEPFQALKEMARVLSPGGVIFVRDLFRPPDQATLQHLVQTYAGDANPLQQKMYSESLHAALTLSEVQDMVVQLGFDPAAVRMTSDRHWTWSSVRN